MTRIRVKQKSVWTLILNDNTVGKMSTSLSLCLSFH